jgi:glutathione synthase/RimK-type ligase-like ATP-grasp enzyme
MDYRIIVVGGKFVAGMKRVNRQGDFRSNVALGGSRPGRQNPCRIHSNG